MYVFDNNLNEVKGRIPDMLWVSGGPAQMSNFPNATPYDYIKAGNCMLPWVTSSAMNL